MGIYSANRMSSVRTGSMRPDMSYAGTAGIGRCMYESTVNDCILGESLLMQDFNEVRAMREGTVLESEMRVMQENVVTDFFKKCKELLIKLGKKIAGIFRQVYAKLTQWFVRSGKAYVKMHRKTVLSKNISNLEIKKYRKPKNFETNYYVNKISSLFDKFSADAKKNYDQDRKIGLKLDKDVDETVKLFLDGEEPTELYDHMMEKAYDDEDTISGSDIKGQLTKILSNVENGSKTIKDLKKAEKNFKDSIKKAQNTVDKIEREAGKEKLEGKAKDVSDSIIARFRVCISAYQQAMNVATSATIRVLKFGIKQDRSVIAQIVAYTPKAESGLLMREAAEDAADEIDEVLDSPEEEEVADGMPEFDDVDTADSDDSDDED